MIYFLFLLLSFQALVANQPQTLEELQQIIREASSKGIPIKAIGNGYSISDIAHTNGIVISLKNLRSILAIDAEKQRVRVEAGISLHELNEQLAAKGLALPNQAAIAEISLGGAVSTGVHGTGHTGTISSFVTKIELITADGVMHSCSKQEDSDAFNAATLSLGALGVIYAVTLQCEPLFYLKYSRYDDRIENTLQYVERELQANDFFQFTWDVHTGKTVISQWNRTTHDTEGAMPSYKALAWYTIDQEDKDLFSEIAIPIHQLPNAIEKVKQVCQKYTQRGAVFTEVNVRFINKESCFLSPASKGPVATLALSVQEGDKYREFYQEVEEVLLEYGGCPHWGKLNFLNYEKVNTLYGINLQRFIQVKHQLDPRGLFSNAFTEKVFKPF